MAIREAEGSGAKERSSRRTRTRTRTDAADKRHHGEERCRTILLPSAATARARSQSQHLKFPKTPARPPRRRHTFLLTPHWLAGRDRMNATPAIQSASWLNSLSLSWAKTARSVVFVERANKISRAKSEKADRRSSAALPRQRLRQTVRSPAPELDERVKGRSEIEAALSDRGPGFLPFM